MTETFEPGELFIYEMAPGLYELGVTNAKWAPTQWASIWGGNRLTLDDLLCVIPGKHTIVVNQNDVEAYRFQSYVGPLTTCPTVSGDYAWSA